MPNKSGNVNRREFLRATGTVGAIGTSTLLAGCSSDNTQQGKTATNGGGQTTSTKKPTPTVSASERQTGGSVSIAIQSDPWTLHPHKATDTSSDQLANNYGNTLLDVTPKGELYPDLAKEMPTVSKDGTQYTFKIHEGVQFHGDYGECTAEDIVENFRLILDKNYGSAQRANFKGILVGPDTDPQNSVQKTGKYEVTFNLAKPYSPFPYKVASENIAFIPIKAIEEYGKNLGNPDVGIWSTGPFKFEKAIPDSHYTFSRFEEYFKTDKAGKKLPYLDKINFRIVPESAVRKAQLKTGQVDITERVAATNVKSLHNAENTVVQTTTGTTIQNMYVNSRTFLGDGSKPFSKKKTRKALGYAANKEVIIQTKFRGLAVPAFSIFPPWHWAYNEDVVTKYRHDPQKAQKLLQEAGETGLSFTCTPTNQPLYVDVAQILQQNYAQVGVDMEIVPKEKSAAWEPFNSPGWEPESWPPKDVIGPPPDAAALIEDIAYGFDADSYAYLQYHTGSYLNSAFYSNKQVDELVEKARTSLDRKKRKKLYSKVQALVTEDMPQVTTVWYKVVQASRKNVQGFQSYPTYAIKLEKVWLK
jgi:peptide/nickel transport system substrate-binding protein